MFGIGTITNVITVIVGGLIGLFAGKKIPTSMRTTLIKVCGISSTVIGISSTLERMLTVNSDGTISANGAIVMVVSLAIGTVIGELLHLDDHVERFGEWLKKKTKSSGDNNFVDAFVSTSVTVSIGAMAILGSINDGLGDPTILITKGLLDMVFVMIMTSSLGLGCVFSAIPILVLQGSMTLIAHFAGAFLSEAIIHNIAFVGSVMIICVGINILWDMKIKVTNMLPGLIIAAVMTFIV